MWGRIWRPISRRSRKPAVVSRATRPPRRWMMALVATVVPWASRCTCPSGTPASASSPSPSRTARPGLSRVDGRFATRISPLSIPTAKKSVNVPPTSTPTIQLTSPWLLHEWYST